MEKIKAAATYFWLMVLCAFLFASVLINSYIDYRVKLNALGNAGIQDGRIKFYDASKGEQP